DHAVALQAHGIEVWPLGSEDRAEYRVLAARGDDTELVLVVHRGLRGCHHTRADPHGVGAEREGCGDSTAVTDAARAEHHRVLAHRVHDHRQQGHRREPGFVGQALEVVATGFIPLGDHYLGTGIDGSPGVVDAAHLLPVGYAGLAKQL